MDEKLGSTTADVSEGSSTVIGHSNENKPWLVMLYQAGDNNLSEEMVNALQSLMAEGPPDGATIVAQFDPSGVGLLTQRYDFSKRRFDNGREKTKLEHYRVGDELETNAGDPRTLLDFIDWARRAYPSKDLQQLLILSGHGSGTTQDFLMKDEASADSLTFDELKFVLKTAHESHKKLDILGMDACYMSGGEIAHEIREHVGILIAAEGLEPAFGWPYGRMLKAAKQKAREKAERADEEAKKAGKPIGNAADPHLTPEELARTIVDVYVRHYADYDGSVGRSADLAAIDLTKIGDVATAFKGLVKALSAEGNKI